MSQEEAVITHRAVKLREAFDRSFSERLDGERNVTEAFLAIGVANDDYALRLSEISGLYSNKKVTPVPSAAADLIGLASFRSALVPIYDLRRLLGYSAATLPRWVVLATHEAPVGLAFDRFNDYLHLPNSAIAREKDSEHGQPYIREALRTAEKVLPIVSVASILESIKKRAQTGVPQRE